MVATAPAGAKTRRTGSGSYGRVNFSERGEGRDDSEYLDIERSKDYHNRALSSPRSDKGDVAIARRKSKSASIRSSVGPEVATAPQERRRERREASSKQSSKALRSRRSEAAPIASSRSKADAQNDISNLGREFELGLVCSDLRSQHSATITNIQSPYYTGEYSSANSTVDKITGATKQSDRSEASNVNIHRSLSSVLAGGGRSRKSSGKVSTANTRSIRNNHSSKKERTSISTSKRKKLQQSEVEYWTGLSVRVAMAVIQTNGSEKMAQKASSIILIEGRRQSAQERSSKMMRALSAKLSVAMLEAKADQKTVLAVMNAVSEYDNNENVVKSAESMSFDDSSTIKTDPNVHVDLAEEIESVAPSVALSAASSIAPSVALSLVPTIRSNRSKAVSTVRSNRSKAVSTVRSNRSVVNPSMSSKRSKLQTIEMQILEKQMAIEEAELRNQEREREFNERIAAMKAATNERLAALDATKDSLLEEEESTLAHQQVILADEWQRTRSDIKQEDNGNEKVNAGYEKVNAFQSGLDDFVMGFNEQMTALDIAAKEGLASLDATKASLLEKSGLTQADRGVDATAEVNRSANKENNVTGAVSAIQSGIGGFVLGINQQLAALSAAAKEKLAGLDATKTAGSIVGSTKGDRKDVTADESRNIHEDVKQEDNSSALQMFKSRLLHSFDCGDGPKVNSSSSSGKGDDLALWEI